MPPDAPPRPPIQLTPEQVRVKEGMQRRTRMSRVLGRIKHKVIVMSGKGGVGKTTVAVNLAADLAQRGYSTGLLDMDLTGPDVPLMLGLQGKKFPQGIGLIHPLEHPTLPLKVASMAFVLGDDTPIVWRGPLKAHALTQFLGDVAWGDLDVLVVDLPPGTSDEPLAVAEAIPEADGIVIVTTPQAVSTLDVRKAVQFTRLLKQRVLGVVENMSGFTCPDCGSTHDLFGRGGGEQLAHEENVPFLGAVPLDADMVRRGDAGEPVVVGAPDAPAGAALARVGQGVLEAIGEPPQAPGRRGQANA